MFQNWKTSYFSPNRWSDTGRFYGLCQQLVRNLLNYFSEPEVLIQYPKRKKLGRIIYYRPLDSELKNHLNKIYTNSNEGADHSELNVSCFIS